MSQTISTESLSHESRTFPPSPAVVSHALLNAAQFDALYKRSVREPEKFWLEQAQTLEWFKPPTVAGKHTWDTDARKIEHTYFEDGQLNLTVNCLDRHPARTEATTRGASNIALGDRNRNLAAGSLRDLCAARSQTASARRY